jgi:hypothetical protein
MLDNLKIQTFIKPRDSLFSELYKPFIL